MVVETRTGQGSKQDLDASSPVGDPNWDRRPQGQPEGDRGPSYTPSDADETLAATGVEDTARKDALELPLGTALADRYVIEARIGAGGMGVVYLAHDPLLDRRVAVKLLRATPVAGASEGRARARLLREARAMAQLSHPNIVAVHDVGEVAQGVFIAMEFVEGQTLRGWLAAIDHSYRQIIDVFVDVARGLQAAHDAGLVHRDVKPDNVMVGDDGRVRVMDFGLARTDERRSPTMGVAQERESPTSATADATPDASIFLTHGTVGTPRYMSAEQFLGEACDARSDQFSYAVALYEALYGSRPFAGDSYAQLAMAVTQGELRPAPAKPGVPRWLAPAVERALALDPRERWPNMRTFAGALSYRIRDARRRRFWIGAAIATSASAAVAAVAMGPASAAEACPTARPRIEAVWGDAQRQTLATLREQPQHAALSIALTRAERELDTYADDWVDAVHDNCVATQVENTQSNQLLDERSFCLAARKNELAAVVEALLDGNDLPKSDELLATLTPVSSCDAAALDRGDFAPPSAGPERDRADADTQAIARARVALERNDHEAARRLLVEAGLDARRSPYPPLAAQTAAAWSSVERAAGNYDEAAKHTRESLDLAAEHGLDRQLVRSWTRLARIVGYEQRQVEAGQALITAARVAQRRIEASDELESALGDELELGIEAAHGAVSYAGSDFEAAQAHWKKALELSVDLHGEVHPSTAGHMTSLGYALTAAGDYPAAQAQLERAVDTYEQSSGKDHPAAAAAVMNLAQAHELQGHRDAAFELHERAVRLMSSWGDDHPYYAIALRGLARARLDRGELEPALELFERAVQINETRLGPKHHETANALSNLAEVHVAQQQWDKALPLVERCLAILHDNFGPSPLDHLDIAIAYKRRGDIRLALDEPQRAVEDLRLALAGFEKHLGPDHAYVGITARSIARFEIEHGSTTDAVALFERTIEIFRKQYGADSVYLAGARAELGRRLADLPKLSAQQRTKAREQLRAAVAIYRTQPESADALAAAEASLQKLGG